MYTYHKLPYKIKGGVCINRMYLILLHTQLGWIGKRVFQNFKNGNPQKVAKIFKNICVENKLKQKQCVF